MQLSDLWTLKHATRIGLVAALAALLLWPLYAVVQEPVRAAFVAALAVVAFCGVSILFITAVDLLTVVRGRRVLPARIFDLLLGAALAVPAGLALAGLLS